MKITLAGKIRNYTRALYRNKFGYPVVYDVFDQGENLRSRALLAYLVDPFLPQNQHKKNDWHTNWAQNRDIAEILNQMGFIVDVMNWSDTKTVLKYDYQLMLSMGRISERLVGMLPESTQKIYISTGSEGTFNNGQEDLRIADVRRRRGCELVARRIVHFDSEYLKYFDAVSCLGNQFIANTYRPFHDNIFTLNNYAFDNLSFMKRDFATARKNFMYLASGGQIHKGLDLLLEVFAKNPQLNLYVCSPFKAEKDFVSCYKKELYEMPNIHSLGWQDINSKAFRTLCHQCAFTILPSCAEGQVGSVIMCMYTGMIPIVSPACGIDADSFGHVLSDCSLENIEKIVIEWSEYSVEKLSKKSQKTREIAQQEYSPEQFRKNWQYILNQVVKRDKAYVNHY